MWVLYGGAILVAMRNTYKVAINRDHPLHELASMALSVQVLIAGLCFTGPAFNTQLGILFWLMTAICMRRSGRSTSEALAADAKPKLKRQPSPRPTARRTHTHTHTPGEI
jgi:hypothetical protein